MKGSSETTVLLRNVRAVLLERVIDEASLLVQDGRIARIFDSPHTDFPSAQSVLYLDGLTLLSGFIDVHIHGAVGVDTMDASADELRSVSQFLATNGVTGWLPTLVPAPLENYESALRAIEQAMTAQHSPRDTSGDDVAVGRAQPPPLNVAYEERAGCQRSQEGARVLGVHYEGPFLNTAQCGALRSKYFKTYSAPGDLGDLPVPASGNAVRMITVAPEIVGGVELIRELSSRGWIVSIGHTRADLGVLDRAFEAGARHMTHFMNAMAPLHHRSPGPVAWGLAHDDVTCDLIADGIHLDPFMLRLLLKMKEPNRLALISDAIAAAGKGDGEYSIWGETITVANGRTRNASGSIAGSVITMLDAVRRMLSLGASEIEVARMASTNPARLLRIDQDCGSIEEGKRADLVGLDNQGNVRLTLVGGEIAYIHPELQLGA